MSTWYAQNGSGDFLTYVVWNSAPDGSGASQGPGGFSISDGDVYDLNGQTGIEIETTLQADITIQDTAGGSGGINLATTVGANAVAMLFTCGVIISSGIFQSATVSAPIIINCPLLLTSSMLANSPLVLGPSFEVSGPGGLTVYSIVDATALASGFTLSGFYGESGYGACLVAAGNSPPAFIANQPMTIFIPVNTQVENGVSFGLPGAEYNGACQVPLASDVRYGHFVGDTTGTLVVPSTSQVEAGVTFDNGSVGTLASGGAPLSRIRSGY